MGAILGDLQTSISDLQGSVISFLEHHGLSLASKHEQSLMVLLTHRDDYPWTAGFVEMPDQCQTDGISALDARLLIGLLLFDENILHTTHLDRTARHVFHRLHRIIRNAPGLNKQIRHIYVRSGSYVITAKTGAQIEISTRLPHIHRGKSADVLVFDESQMLTAHEVEEISPVLAASQRPVTIHA